MTMDRYLLAEPMRFIDQRFHLLGCKLRNIHLVGQRQNAAGDCGLDYIGAILHFKPNDMSNGIRTVPDSPMKIRLLSKHHVTIAIATVEVTASRTHPLGGDQH